MVTDITSEVMERELPGKTAGTAVRSFQQDLLFGSTPGRVVEKHGWQKVTDTKGKFFGWFYFDSKGNHYKSQMLTAKSSGKSYYFNSTGQLVGVKPKLAANITSLLLQIPRNHRGWMYKNTLIRYQNKWYYADKNGVLKRADGRNPENTGIISVIIQQ